MEYIEPFDVTEMHQLSLLGDFSTFTPVEDTIKRCRMAAGNMASALTGQITPPDELGKQNIVISNPEDNSRAVVINKYEIAGITRLTFEESASMEESIRKTAGEEAARVELMRALSGEKGRALGYIISTITSAVDENNIILPYMNALYSPIADSEWSTAHTTKRYSHFGDSEEFVSITVKLYTLPERPFEKYRMNLPIDPDSILGMEMEFMTENGEKRFGLTEMKDFAEYCMKESVKIKKSLKAYR